MSTMSTTVTARLARRIATVTGLSLLLVAFIATPALMITAQPAAAASIATTPAAGIEVAGIQRLTPGRSAAPIESNATTPARTTDRLMAAGVATDLPGIPGIGCGLLAWTCDGGDDKDDDDGDGGGIDIVPGLLQGEVGNVIGEVADITDPFGSLGSAIAKAAASAWTAAMLAIWNAGLLFLRIILTFSEWFLTPDLSENGPGKQIYSYALWMAGGLAGIMVLIQLGLAAFKREGKSLARAAIGTGQFAVVCACWFAYCTIIVLACGGITHGLMKALLGVNSWPEFDPLGEFTTKNLTDAVVATVLGGLGCAMFLAAIGHLLVYLARGAALLVLAASGPISAAGLVSEAGRPWFWKSLRWFHAAAFTPVLMVLVLGIGVQFATQAAVGSTFANPSHQALGTAIPAVVVMLVSIFAPLALFKLFAFVDPGTPSGASFHQGLAAQGGLGKLFGGGGDSGSQASQADSNGRSAGEQGAEEASAGRFAKKLGGLGGGAGLGGGLAAGQAISRGLGMLQSLGAKSTSLVSDVSNQAGIGHHTFGPDFSNAASGRGDGGRANDSAGGEEIDDQGDDDGSDPTSPPPPPPPPARIPPRPRTQGDSARPTPTPPSSPPPGHSPRSSDRREGTRRHTPAADQEPPRPPGA